MQMLRFWTNVIYIEKWRLIGFSFQFSSNNSKKKWIPGVQILDYKSNISPVWRHVVIYNSYVKPSPHGDSSGRGWPLESRKQRPSPLVHCDTNSAKQELETWSSSDAEPAGILILNSQHLKLNEFLLLQTSHKIWPKLLKSTYMS